MGGEVLSANGPASTPGCGKTWADGGPASTAGLGGVTPVMRPSCLHLKLLDF